MDFNVFIADFTTSVESLTKESAASGSFSSVYCRKVSKAVDQIASNSEYSNVVTGLWCVAMNVAAHVKYLNPIRAFSQLCLKIFRQCAKVILNIQWQNLEEDSPLRQNFLASLEALHEKLVPLSFTQFHLLEGLVEDPWTHPTLAKIMGGEIDDCNKEEVHSYIENEDPIILQLRVDLMLKENCEEFALNLCNSYLSHPKLQSDLDIKKTQLSLLYKLGQEDKLQEECQKLNIQDAVQVIRLLQTSRTHRKMCTVLTQTFMVQNWIRPSNVEAGKELLKLWIRHQLVVDKELDQFKESVWAVAKLSQATEQIALLIDVLREECGDSFLQLFVDMCIFAINVDKGQMEANRNEGNREAAAARRNDMASICDKLSSLCHHISIKVARMCALTAFALKPTEVSFRKIATFYGQGRSGCDQSLKGKSQCPEMVNPATLYEVERLLNMLRPGYLNPDQLFSKIQVLCRTYLQECLKKAEEFQKLQCSSQSSSDNSRETAAQIDTSGTSASSTTSCMSSILAESFSTEDIQNIHQLLSRMRLLNIAYSNAPLQNLEAFTPTIPSLPGSASYDHTYQVNKNKSIKQQHQHNLIKEGDKIQEKDNRAEEKLQTTNMNQPPKAELTHQHLQYTKQLHEIIQAALEQDSATLLKLAQSSSPEMIQTAINIIKSKLPNSSVSVHDQQHKSASSQINNTVLSGAHPTGSAQLQPSNNLQQRQSQPNLQPRQERIREDPSQTQSSRSHSYNKPVVKSVGNNLPPPQVQAIRVQIPNSGSYLSPSNVTVVDNGKQVIATSAVLHNVNPVTTSSRASSGNLSQQKLKAESLLLAKSCVGEIRHLLQSQLSDLQQKPTRDHPQMSGSAATLTGAGIASTSSGVEFSSSHRLQTAAELVKRATVSKIQENFSQRMLYKIQQNISKQEQNGMTLPGRPYTLSILQPRSLGQSQRRDHSSNQQTISNLIVPSSVGLSGLKIGNAKPCLPPASHGILQSIKPHMPGSVVPSAANATHKPQNSSLVVIKQPKIISLSNLPDFPGQSSVIESNTCPALYVTTCPVSCLSNISLSTLNNHHSSPFTQHNCSNPNAVSQSSLTNTQNRPLYQTNLSNLNTVTVSSLSNQQLNPSVQHIFPKMVSQSSLNNSQSKPSYQHILYNLNTINVSSLSNQQPSPVVKHILSNLVSQPSWNNSHSQLLTQNSPPKLQTMTVSGLNNLQASPSVEHATKPSTSTLSAFNNKEQHLVQNICSKPSEEIASGQQLEVILTNAASVRPQDNATVLLQRDDFSKSNETVDNSQGVTKGATVSDSSCSDVSNNALYRCILCNVAFKTLDDLRYHVKYVCKPEQQSISVCNTKFKLTKASAKNSGIEATTVFQCLRCLELCISEAGIKQHRLICKKVPLKFSQLKEDSPDNQGKEALTVTVGYNSSSIEENDNCNKSESEGSSEKEFNNKTGDSYGGPLVSAVSMDSSCQLSADGQIEDSIDQKPVASALGIRQPINVGRESPEHRELESISKQETANDMEINTLLKSQQIVVTSAVSQCERKQPLNSCPRDMFSTQVVNGAQINNLVNTESRIISSQQTLNHVQTNSSLNTESRITPSQLVMTDALTNPESRIIPSRLVMTDAQTNLESRVIPSQHVMTNALTNPESRIIPSQHMVTDAHTNLESRVIPSQHVVTDALTNPESRIIPRQHVVTDAHTNSESRIIPSQHMVTDAHTNPELWIIPNQRMVTDPQTNPESRFITSQHMVTDAQTHTELSNGLLSIPEPPSHLASAVPIKSECVILPEQLPVTLNSSTTLAAMAPAPETVKCHLATFQTDLIQPVSMSNSENCPPLSTDLNNYSKTPQISVAPVITNTAYQMSLTAAFLNTSSVISKENTLFPLSKFCFSTDDVITNKNILGSDNFVEASPRKQALRMTKVLPGAACADLDKSCRNKFAICEACSKIICSTGSFHMHCKMCTTRNKAVVKTRPLQEKVQNAEHLREDVFSGLKRVVENVPGGNGDAPKVEHVESMTSSVVPMMQVCTDVKKRNLQENKHCSMLQSNAEQDGSSQRDIQEIKTGVMAVDSGAGNTNTSDILVFMEKSSKIKEVVINESKDADLITKTLPERIDTEDRLSQVENEECSFMNCVEGDEKPDKTKANENKVVRDSTESNTNSRTQVDSDKGSLFCQICQVLYRRESILLQHFVVKHLRPYTVKTSNSSLSYVCHFCQNSFTTFEQYMQHMPHHSVIVYKKIKSFHSAQTSQRSQRNSLHEKLTKKRVISKNMTMTLKKSKVASRPAARRFKSQSLAVRTRAFLDRRRMSRGLPSCCEPAGEDNSNKSDAIVVEQRSAIVTACSPATTCLMNNNIADHDEPCCRLEKNALISPELVREKINQKINQGNQVVDDTCDGSSRNTKDSPVARRKAIMKNHSWISKRRRMSEVKEVGERDQEHSTLGKRIHSGQPGCYINPDHSDNRNSADLQVAQHDNVDLLEDYGKTEEPRNNGSVFLNQRHRKNLQPNGAQLKSVETLLCSKDLEADSNCSSDSAISADHLQLPVVKDAKPSATNFHVDVTTRSSSFVAPKTVKPSFLDSYMTYISNYPLSGDKSASKKEK